jgi:hypothetical protein
MQPQSALQCSQEVPCSEEFDIAVEFCVCVREREREMELRETSVTAPQCVYPKFIKRSNKLIRILLQNVRLLKA